jgi:hypothetical protein
MKTKLTNILLYTWTYILIATVIAGIFGGAYLLVEMILANL